MNSHVASRVTMESIRDRMIEVEKIHRQGKQVAITDTLVKDVGWLFRRIEFLTTQVRRLESELEALTKSDGDITSNRLKMLMERVQDAEEKMRVSEEEKKPLIRENNALKQDMKLLLVRAQRAEIRVKELSEKLERIENGTETRVKEESQDVDVLASLG
ncbi:hypothetical protein PITCH_A800011 [uncultured Desulfobacterium sp.]|uniref:Uncharacterized protein n=1 Tax=uncultured Desulfobacterium sp. TaxID=201089 RepID=A0A445N2Z0_9BACT|nr:hypothetical protein PITCH_A800011 [uncultured Desulfobacterium sp.]